VVYSDESGVGSIKKEPLTVVTAVVINMDDQWESVEATLRVAEMGTPRTLLHKKHQLRGSVLYGAVRKGIPEASTVLKEILSIPVRERLGIFYGAVDRAGCIQSLNLPKDRSPVTEYNLAFNECLNRVDTAARIFASKERVLWIAHQSDSQREPATTSSHFWHKRFTEVRIRADPSVTTKHGLFGLGIAEGTIVEATGDKSSIVDTVYFGSAEHSIALQLADVCCSTITLHLLEKFYKWTPIVEPFYELIRLRIMTPDIIPTFLKGS
jgi:hypothetical protein